MMKQESLLVSSNIITKNKIYIVYSILCIGIIWIVFSNIMFIMKSLMYLSFGIISIYVIRYVKKYYTEHETTKIKERYIRIDKGVVNFDDVVGYDDVKKNVMLSIQNIMNIKNLKSKGFIFYGDHGTGKTMLAKAISSEISYPVYMIKDYTKYVDTLKHITYTNGSSIIIMDDVTFDKSDNPNKYPNVLDDADMPNMSNFLESITSRNVIIIIITTDNHNIIPMSIKKNGRIDTIINFSVPNKNSIVEMMKRNFMLDDDDIMSIANNVAGSITYADIVKMKNNIDMIMPDNILEYIFKTGKNFGGDIRRTNHYEIDERSKLRVVYHELGHFMMALIIKSNFTTAGIICDHGDFSLGRTLFNKSYTYTLNMYDLIALCCIKISGSIFERLLFGDASTGNKDDMDLFNESAELIVTDGLIQFELMTKGYGITFFENAENKYMLMHNVKISIKEYAYALASKIVAENRKIIENLKDILMEKSYLCYRSVEKADMIPFSIIASHIIDIKAIVNDITTKIKSPITVDID